MENYTKYIILDNLRVKLKSLRTHLGSQIWRDNCTCAGSRFDDNWSGYAMSDQDELAGLFALQTCARHLFRLPGHENYICDCEEALHSLQKVLSTNGWFFHFLSPEHATLPQKAKDRVICQDFTRRHRT